MDVREASATGVRGPCLTLGPLSIKRPQLRSTPGASGYRTSDFGPISTSPVSAVVSMGRRNTQLEPTLY